jgi:hypothetical protein
MFHTLFRGKTRQWVPGTVDARALMDIARAEEATGEGPRHSTVTVVAAILMRSRLLMVPVSALGHRDVKRFGSVRRPVGGQLLGRHLPGLRQ